MAMRPTAPVLVDVLAQSRTEGFLGPGPVEDHMRHSQGFATAAGSVPDRFLDLGAGGGVPGLALLLMWPRSHGVLLDSSERRTQFLQRAVRALGLEGRTDVVRARAEEAGRDVGWRSRFTMVVARGFGPPAVTAECGSPFLALGGSLVVSEPPPAIEGEPAEGETGSETGRWPASGLALLGLVDGGCRRLEEGRFRVLVQHELCGPRFPRRTGVPAKRPLF